MSISSNLRMLRKRAGITQIDLARDLEISIATLRRWEAGETTPTGSKINELARYLGVSPEEIMSSGVEANDKIKAVNSGMLVFENGGTRVELPPTEQGYELFNRLVENLINQKN